MSDRASNVLLAFSALAAFSYVVYARRKKQMDARDPMILKVRENFAKLHPSYYDIPIQSGSSAYTENKKYITLCLRDPKTNNYYDINTIMFVALHELSHILTPPGHDEHGDVFKKTFSEVLRKASIIGIYNPSLPVSSMYCNVATGM